METRLTGSQPILVGVVAASTGAPVNVASYKNVQIQLATSGNATFTVKIQGSLSKDCPTFSSAASATNRWDYVACYDYNDPSSPIVGSTGIASVATDVCKNLLVNVDGLTWLNVTVTARAQGTINADAVFFTNH